METDGRPWDFVVRFDPPDGDAFRFEVESPQGEGEGVFQLPGDPGSWGEARSDLVRASRNLTLAHGTSRPFSPKAIGSTLFRALFTASVGVERLFAGSLARAESAGEALRIKLRFRFAARSPADRRLRSLPWELLYDETRDEFLSFQRQTSIVRTFETALPIAFEPSSEAPRLLLVPAQPTRYPRLDLASETRGIEEAWEGRGEVEVLASASVEALHESLVRRPVHCLHFLGHGDVDPASGKARLFFESRDGSSDPVSAETLATLLKGVETPRLVFLNACETARPPAGPSDDDLLLAAAESLALGGIPSVLAMQLPVSDPNAVRFGRTVHFHLAAGETLERAVAIGRHAVHALDREGLEWAVPVLYSRGPAAPLRGPEPVAAPSRTGTWEPDVRIDGPWVAEIVYHTERTNSFRLTIEQTGRKVTGRAVCTEGSLEGTSYEIQGEIADRVLACTYTLVDKARRQIESGAMVVKVRRNGKVMKGYLVYSDDLDDEIYSVSCDWWNEAVPAAERRKTLRT